MIILRFGCQLRKGQLLITHALLGHYHAELHEAEAPPEDILRCFAKRSALSKRTRTLGHYHTEPY